MRLGIAGVGRMGAFHARTLSATQGVAGLVLADPNPNRRKQLADELAADVVDSVEGLFSANIDGLVIAASTDAHAGLVLAAVEVGLPVFCEKPVATTVEETVAVLRAVETAGARVHVGFQRRFDPGYIAARNAVVAGELGQVHTLRANTLDPGPPPPEYVRASGGFFRDGAVHDFDAIRWVSGREVTDVYAAGANHGAAYFAEAGDVDLLAALLTLDDGAFALVSASRYNARGYDVRLEVLGSTDGIVVGLDDGTPLRSVEPGVTFPAGVSHPGFMQRFLRAYRAELAAFVELVAGTGQPVCTVRDALEAVYVAEACELSRAERRRVALDEVRR